MTEQRKTINDLIAKGHRRIIITSGQDSAFIDSKKNMLLPVRKYTTEELIEWLKLNEIPQLTTGQYWRESIKIILYTENYKPG